MTGAGRSKLGAGGWPLGVRSWLCSVLAVAVLAPGGPAKAGHYRDGPAAAGNSQERSSRNLEIYWIDAEGGAATLIVAPGGESLLVDSANRTPDDRDAKRIVAAAARAGLTRIDMLLTTHFHGDHIGAMAALAKTIPIGMYMDHGESVEIARPNVKTLYKAYEDQTAGHRKILK